VEIVLLVICRNHFVNLDMCERCYLELLLLIQLYIYILGIPSAEIVFLFSVRRTQVPKFRAVACLRRTACFVACGW
jgi:hypothetical protein